jgi:DNA-binding CsgD family transcriptional regulator
VAGKSAWEIGQILSLSERTIRFHLDNVKRKFGANGKTGVIAKALQLRIAQF